MLKELALASAYRVTPTGLYLISTAYQGKRNVQFAFRALGLTDDPPLLVIGIQADNFSREVIQQSHEFVVNVCAQNQLQAVDKSRGLSGRTVEDKFAALGLETLPAQHVQAPLVAGCHANVECKLVNSLELDGLYLFVGQALASYIDDQVQPVGPSGGKDFSPGSSALISPVTEERHDDSLVSFLVGLGRQRECFSRNHPARRHP